MSVLAEALSVIEPRPVLAAKYLGGIAAYLADAPNRTICTDEDLTRVGFMSPSDVEAFVRRLESYGLVYLRDGTAIDLCVVDQHRGPTTPCGWIDGGKHPDGYAAVWLAGADPSTMYAPAGWTPAQSAGLGFVSSEDADDRLLGLAERAGVETILDLQTGREVSVGRAKPGPARTPRPPADTVPGDIRSLKDAIAGELQASYKHRDPEGARCSCCNAGDRPLAFHKIEKHFDEGVTLPDGALALSSSRGRVRAVFPVCSTCAPPCGKCELPEPTERVLEFSHAIGATNVCGICSHVHIRLLLLALFKRLFRVGRFGGSRRR